jgi:hypothetical protein
MSFSPTPTSNWRFQQQVLTGAASGKDAVVEVERVAMGIVH